MAHWLVQLNGDAADLALLRADFPDGDFHVIVQEGTSFLTGSGFEQCASAENVLRAARRETDNMAAIRSLLDPTFQRPTVGNVIRVDDEARRHVFMFVEPAELRIRGAASVSFVGQAIRDGVEIQPAWSKQVTQAQNLGSTATGSQPLNEALKVWADPARTWARLYRVLEELEKHLGDRSDRVGLCLSAERDRFTRTANTAEVAGLDARHGSQRFQPPADPMTLREATEFIRGLFLKVLRRQ
jgi:hypothetical protein